MSEAAPQEFYGDAETANSGSTAGSLIGTTMSWLGALTSIALVAGLAFWGYKLTVRDVSGVPVVRALEGPMRVRPEDPGGTEAAHQGLAVNAVQAEGAAAPPADRLVLAPRPIDLSNEAPRARPVPVGDVDASPGAEAGDTEISVPDTAVEAMLTGPDATMEPDNATDAEDPAAAALRLADEIAAEAAPLEPLETTRTAETPTAPAVPAADETAEAVAEIIPASLPGVSRSPRPTPRPEVDLVAQAAAAAVRLSVPVAAISIDPASIPSGTRLVQLGAFDSEDVAKKEWDRLSKQFEAYLVDKKRVIQEAKSGGRTFFRLRAMGFADINDARRFCSALLAENAACIPVVTR